MNKWFHSILFLGLLAIVGTGVIAARAHAQLTEEEFEAINEESIRESGEGGGDGEGEGFEEYDDEEEGCVEEFFS